MKSPPIPPWCTFPWSNYSFVSRINYFEFIYHSKAFRNNFVTHACLFKLYIYISSPLYYAERILPTQIIFAKFVCFKIWFLFSNSIKKTYSVIIGKLTCSFFFFNLLFCIILCSFKITLWTGNCTFVNGIVLFSFTPHITGPEVGYMWLSVFFVVAVRHLLPPSYLNILRFACPVRS